MLSGLQKASQDFSWATTCGSSGEVLYRLHIEKAVSRNPPSMTEPFHYIASSGIAVVWFLMSVATSIAKWDSFGVMACSRLGVDNRRIEYSMRLTGHSALFSKHRGQLSALKVSSERTT
jgi:hypothetical protein